MPTYLGESEIVVSPSATSHTTSHFTGQLHEYRTGDFIEITITARDVFNNLRGSTDDSFTLEVLDELSEFSSGEILALPNGDGTYSVAFMFTVVSQYTIKVRLGSDEILGSPV